MLSKLKRILWIHRPRPAFEDDEEIILEGVAVLMQALVGARSGPLILTNRRLILYETAVARPLKPISGQLNLSDIASVDKGTWLDFVGGGRRRKSKCLWEGQGRLDEWIETIRRVIAKAEEA